MIKDNILKIKSEIENISRRINCSLSDITLVAVTKGVPSSRIKEAINAGICDIGENYIQEARDKYNEITRWIRENNQDIKLRWHFIGHLQKNKVKYIDIFDLIHSVDSLELAEEISKHSVKKNKFTNILLQVNISNEPTKFGIKKEDIFDNVYKIVKLPNLKILGLMTIAPFTDDAESVRWIFRELYNMFCEIKEKIIPLKYISAGMTQDWKVAIEEGANIIRLKTAIFGGE